MGPESRALTQPWVARWSTPRWPAVHYAPCQVPSGRATNYLVLGFGQSTTVDRIVIQPGLDRGNSGWSDMYRPSLVDVLFGNHHCARLTLADRFSPQQFAVHVAGVRNVMLRVVGAFPPEADPGFTGTGAAVISEVAFMRRR